jgi:hypothetical protein
MRVSFERSKESVPRAEQTRLFKRDVRVGKLALQFVNGAHQRLTRALQRIASSSHRDGECRISEVSWVMNPSPILLRPYPALEFVCRPVEIGHYGFHLRDPLARIVDSYPPRTIEPLDSSMVVAKASFWIRNLVEGRRDTKLRLAIH